VFPAHLLTVTSPVHGAPPEREDHMTEKLWADVDAYLVEKLVPADPVIDGALAANVRNRLPPIDVSAAQGRFLEILVRITGAKNILEIGTLGGYSTLWMAKGQPEGGRIVTLEFSPVHAMVARGNFKAAGLTDRIDLRVGPALETLPAVERDGRGPFDLVFIDADKPNNPGYLDWAVKLSRPGTVIVLDNVVRDGKVIETGGEDSNVGGARAGFDFLSSHPRLTATALQTVGAKGYDGFAIAIVGPDSAP
jgi:predicted O-methyltransferase YrrM